MRELTLTQIKSEANHFMKVHGLLKEGWSFRFDNAKSRFGCCKYTRKEITLSKYLIQYVKSDDDIIDTILHEIAHALVGSKHGHDAVWVRKAKEIGCRGTRCGSGKISDRTKMEYKWTGTCPNGHEIHRHKLTKNAKAGSCSQCSNRFDPELRLDWQQNY